MTMSLHAIEDLLRALLPVGDARFEYRLAQGERPVFEDDDGHIRMRAQLIEGDPSMFVRAAAPADRDLLVFPAYEVRSYEPERMMPPMESPFYEVLDADVVHDSAWYARFARVATMNDDVDPELPLHRLLGYTTELQGDPYLEAEVASLGQTFDGWQRDGERERALQRGATRWRLLLQIDSAPRNTLLAQDGGFFYFLIPEEDLAARRFDQVWGISQGH